MSAFYILALLAIWMFIGKVLYRLWRRWHQAVLHRKILHIVIGILLFSTWFGGAFWEVTGKKMYWDAKVRALCAIDGGVKVYETVMLPAEKFNKWGQPNFFNASSGEDALGEDYIFRTEITECRSANPSISKRLYQVIRREDNTLLGESVTYVRSGGDLPGPWFESKYRCPKSGGVIALLVAVFQQTTDMGGE